MLTAIDILKSSRKIGFFEMDICSVVDTLRSVREQDEEEEEEGKTRRFVGSLFQYANTGDYRSLEYKLKTEPESIRSVDSWGRTALHWAVSAGRVDAVKLLYDMDCDVIRVPDVFGLTPLDHAFLCSRLDVLKIFRGFNTTFTNKISSDTLKLLSSYRYEIVTIDDNVKLDHEQQQKSKEKHAFWSTQPMEKATTSTKKGRIKHMTRESASKMGALTRNMASRDTSYAALPIPAPFVWCSGNSMRKSELSIEELINLLDDTCEEKNKEKHFALDNDRSLEPSRQMWRYKLTVGELSGVEWRGIRSSKGGSLIAFIAGTKFTVYLCGKKTQMLEIHSLFVHPRCRGRRLTPLLVQSMILHGIDIGVQHAIHTHRKCLPVGKPITTLTYSFRPLNVPNLLKCKRIRACNYMFETCSDVVMRYAIPPRPKKNDHFVVRRLKSLNDARAANEILRKSSYELYASMSDEEMQKRFMPQNMNGELMTYGMFCDDRLVSFVSYYALMETFRDSNLRACVILCIASSDFEKYDMESLLLELMHITKQNGFDLIYSLDAMNLRYELSRMGFLRTSSERVHYYVYNYLCTPPLKPSEVGLVLP